jgi:uncharacterized coiled-coil protein SlyX
MDEMVMVVERLSAAAAALEQAVERMASRQESFAAEAQETVGRIVATVESAREAELERKLAEAEARIAEANGKIAAMEAAASGERGRRTVPAGVARMLGKDGLAVESLQAESIDGALGSLSVEQRIAVKSELLRAGLLG